MLPPDTDASSRHNMQLRTTLAWSCSAMMHVWATGRKPFLTNDEVQESCALGRLWMQIYQQLAWESVRSQRLLWHIRPKLHFLDHMLGHTEDTHANPEAFANWLDEDHMKWLAKIAAAVHTRGAGMQLARRYLLRRTIAWQR